MYRFRRETSTCGGSDVGGTGIVVVSGTTVVVVVEVGSPVMVDVDIVEVVGGTVEVVEVVGITSGSANT